MKKLDILKKEGGTFLQKYARNKHARRNYCGQYKFFKQMEKDLIKLSPEEFDKIMNSEKDDKI